ncbi:hypothetical protein PNP85_13605 [Halobacterium salinarum]|uniref:hypothetical protein n=1 Tax=Halobacterium salinarum TaxID=2242 RepID=UPI00255704A3|nr:hypothetical protein [Halobacterium salinarum]MDL0136049.1 hypothetical protein [Halobacterium salinarum]MDL0140539.1 hypothetical protein [Halobacterium salinarum]
MSSLNLEYPREDAKTLIKLAFENTRGIETYNDNGVKITGKTGGSLSSYGEIVTVDVPEGQASDEQTMISIQSEKEVEMNITANPDKYESRFLDVLNRMCGRPIEELLDEHSDSVTEGNTKEVASTDEQADGKSLLYVVLAVVFIMMFFFMLMPLIML